MKFILPPFIYLFTYLFACLFVFTAQGIEPRTAKCGITHDKQVLSLTCIFGPKGVIHYYVPYIRGEELL